jgi:hypothetical protein
VTYPGFTPVGNATLVVANVLTCNKHSQSTVVAAKGHFRADTTRITAERHAMMPGIDNAATQGNSRPLCSTP